MALVPFTVAGNDDLRLAGGTNCPPGNLRLHIDKADYAPANPSGCSCLRRTTAWA